MSKILHGCQEGGQWVEGVIRTIVRSGQVASGPHLGPVLGEKANGAQGRNPSEVSYFLKQVAGIQKGAGKAGHETAGMVSVKAVYEIAQVKAQDNIISSARSEAAAAEAAAAEAAAAEAAEAAAAAEAASGKKK
uniref:Large ribosomal subunit protein uL11 C-terminal domain-containing protein n=1 Tax=Oncorhynchus kisutch TaxID=8019 RepID=A0A8C7IPZ7_ONCKI